MPRTAAEVREFLQPREKQVQAGCYRLVRLVGGQVWNLSQARATNQAAGLPDAILSYRGRMAAFECKRPGGKQSPAQVTFQAACEAAGWTYLLGGAAEVGVWLATPLASCQ